MTVRWCRYCAPAPYDPRTRKHAAPRYRAKYMCDSCGAYVCEHHVQHVEGGTICACHPPNAPIQVALPIGKA